MNARELRVGNFVKTSMSDVDRIQRVGVWCQTDCSIDEIETTSMQPIPLTEEWRLKFGFKESIYKKGFFVKNDFAITLTENGFIVNRIYKSREYKYVHELQNLYFALTGEELTIKQ